MLHPRLVDIYSIYPRGGDALETDIWMVRAEEPESPSKPYHIVCKYQNVVSTILEVHPVIHTFVAEVPRRKNEQMKTLSADRVPSCLRFVAYTLFSSLLTDL